MYTIIDALFSLGGLAFFIACLAGAQPLKPVYSPIAIGWFFLYPILNELIYNLFASVCGEKVVYDTGLHSRFVYHPNSNITLCGVEKLLPFDLEKSTNVYNMLIEKKIIKGEQDVIEPAKIPRALLLEKLSKFYLLKICYSIPVCIYMQMPLCFLPAWFLRWKVLNPMLIGSEGSILAACAATKFKWAVNISGGYHHANCVYGGGLCIYPDISLAVHYVQTRLNLKKVMIIDLDAHQGNGHERDHLNNSDVFIVDAYNHDIFPEDMQARTGIGLDIVVTDKTTDEEYLEKMDSIGVEMDRFKPQFIVYNAGTDILQGDTVGKLSITGDGIIKRDQKLINMCMTRNIPVVIVLSGGFMKENAKIIADSLENLTKKFS